MRPWVAGPLLVAAAALGCAMPGSPPGGEPDQVPPRVLAVAPAMFDTLTELDEPVVIRFDERISERLQGVQEWDEAVLVSPATSPLRVRAGRRELRISLVRGWEPDRVYRVLVRPVYRDYFGNQRVEPIDLVFSTGAPISDAALAGFVSDRLTGRPVVEARVVATRRIDATPYVALTDTAGFFALRFVPAGAYDIRAWQDQDRDRDVDFFEIQDSADTAFGVRDTAVVELALLRPDTTPARLARAEPVDSAVVRLTFDDYFEPGAITGSATIYSLPDSTPLGPGRLLHGSRLDSIRAAREAAAALQEAVRAVEDSIAAADSARAAGPPGAGEQSGRERDARAREQGRLQQARRAEGRDQRRQDPQERPPTVGELAQQRVAGAGRRGAGQDGPALPSRELLLLAPGLLQPDSAYEVRVEGLTNIQGVPGGGGTAPFVMPPPPARPDTVPADTVPADTVPPDTVPARSGGGGR